MNYIESVEISGFWGNQTVSLKFHDDVNFLIGPNGSGKTTIINLLAAALKADIAALYAVQFERITIRLRTIGTNRKPIVEITKIVDEKMGSFNLQYQVRTKSSEKGATYGVEGPFDERIYRDPRYPRSQRLREEGARLTAILSDLVEVNWLSIHRMSIDASRRLAREEGFESSVDQKMREISRGFATYFSLLGSKADIESKNFQEHIFLSLLDQDHTSEDVLKQFSVEPEDKETVVGVLRDLKVTNAKATRSVNAHYRRLNDARDRWNARKGFSIEDAITVSDARRVREMIAKWRDLQNSRREIYRPRTQFEEIINSLLAGKELHFDARNLPKVHLQSADEVGIDVLSSGEKQLFILLGEALLQEERPVVFISDEPELSLHVSWQSSLFENVRRLNRRCQVISATHSPDIVGRFQDKVIQVSECFRNV